MRKDLPKAYEPSQYEDKIYSKWEKSGYFNPDNLDGDPYSIMMPPPNVTGVLHLGHALEDSLMDIMARYQRMKGKKVLLLPGTDHAAVATQAKVEKIFIEQGIKNPREELGREKLLERIREYAENSKSTILKQIKKLGTSCDWSRLAYTFDKKRSHAVNEVFVRMYNDGLIYQGYRVINWSVKGQSTCSDDELVYIEKPAKLYTFKYAKDFPISIATTRPETKLGDTAVAVNPKDKRYKKYIGQTFTVDIGAAKPLNIKIIADENIDTEFGTGAVGVTPAHSIIDFEMYEKQKVKSNPIELIQVIGLDGRMTTEAGKDYEGLTVEKAREKLINWLKNNNLLEKEEEISHSVGTSDRFGDIVEALPMIQWFVNVNKKIPGKDKSLKDLMRQAVTTGHNNDSKQKIKIIPERFEKSYLNWIDNLRDWCISRQIWFGHRIPVWYKKKDRVKLLLVRYGQTDWNKAGIMQGQKDVPLNPKGERDTFRFRKKIEKEKFDLIITSPLKRTSKTAKILNAFGVKVIEDDRLKERSYGKFEGKKTNEVLAEHPEIETFEVNGLPYWINVPTAETYSQVKARVKDFLKDIKKKYAGKRVLVISHGDTLDMFYAILNNVPNEQAYGQFSLNIRLEKYEIGDEEIYVGIESPKDKSFSFNKASEGEWVQDEDTLDTWFSSGLWTFSTLGWPDKTKDLKIFHPTSWMQMGYEILFFWMARMILMSTYVLDKIPFRDVYIHGILRDEKGRKFSKSLGNVIDPVEICQKYGTDALRLSLIIGTTPGNDMNLGEAKIAGFRNFANKLWNIARYVLDHYDMFHTVIGDTAWEEYGLTVADHWILNKFNSLVKEVGDDLNNYRFSQAGERLREFTWNDFADWYIEVSKFEKGDDKERILNLILHDLLKLWHPFMPFVTEVIWQSMGEKELLMTEKWPKEKDDFFDLEVLINFDLIINIIKAIRNARSVYRIKPSQKIEAVIYAGNKVKLIESQIELIKRLRTGIKELEIKQKGEKKKNAIYLTVDNVEIYLEVPDFDFKAEINRLEKEVKEQGQRIKILAKKLANKSFIERAPEQIVQQEKEKLELWQEELIKLKEQLSNLK